MRSVIDCVSGSPPETPRRSFDHLRHDEVTIAPRRSIPLDQIAIHARPDNILAQRCFWCGTDAVVGAEIHLPQLIDIREDSCHLRGHSIEAVIVEFKMRKRCDASRVVAADVHGCGALRMNSSKRRVISGSNCTPAPRVITLIAV